MKAPFLKLIDFLLKYNLFWSKLKLGKDHGTDCKSPPIAGLNFITPAVQVAISTSI